MAQPRYADPFEPTRRTMIAIEPSDHSLQTFQILRFAFTIAPIIAGLDKFTGKLVDWHQYIAPVVTNHIPLSAHAIARSCRRPA